MENSSNCKLLLGDCIDRMKELAENSVDSIVTDSPYGLKFMNKSWDYVVPSVDIWKEALRVIKPGGHLLSFGGTRTYHRMVVNIEDAGFEIRDCIQWLYGSGFPKSLNIKEGDFNGWGTALKPANEPIVVARKPLEKGLTVAENVVKWGTGAINIDGSRIEYQSDADAASATPQGKVTSKKPKDGYAKAAGIESDRHEIDRPELNGRWPANIILDEDAAKALDEQSGPCKTGGRKIKTNCGDAFFKVNVDTVLPEDKGSGASRFFYVAKASKSERNAGLEGMPAKHVGTYAQDEWSRNNMGNTPDAKREPVQNFHPTVKPIKLMQYLINLVTPPQGTVLDPFMGSGSTGVAAKNLNRKFIGIELNEEYFEIAKNRINKLQLELSE